MKENACVRSAASAPAKQALPPRVAIISCIVTVTKDPIAYIPNGVEVDAGRIGGAAEHPVDTVRHEVESQHARPFVRLTSR